MFRQRKTKGLADRTVTPLRVLGIMSGTSLDAVDFALCAIDERHPRLHRHWQAEFPSELRRRLRQAAQGSLSCHGLAQLHHDLGRFYAEAARRGLKRGTVDLAGLHGQTIFHQPEAPPATFQLGEPAYLAESLRVPVVSNFRAADLAVGGQGAPLATQFHLAVFGESGHHVCVNNLGGISNVTSISWQRRGEPHLLAFDTGPANLLMDLAVQHFTNGRRRFDKEGQWARRGTASEKLLRRWLRHPYFLRRPPKSTGREMFGEPFLKHALAELARAGASPFDALATLTEFTARSVALNYRRHLRSAPQRVVLTGGGAANETLVNDLRNQLLILNPRVEVRTSEAYGWPLQAVEPAAFALLAYGRIKRKPGNIPSTTGATRPVLLGQITEVG